MALAADIKTLRDRVLAELSAAHDYHADTIIAWSIVEEFVATGRAFSIQNKLTGTLRGSGWTFPRTTTASRGSCLASW